MYDGADWKKVCEKEIHSLEQKKVWVLVDREIRRLSEGCGFSGGRHVRTAPSSTNPGMLLWVTQRWLAKTTMKLSLPPETLLHFDC